jgi:hypothetical protein
MDYIKTIFSLLVTTLYSMSSMHGRLIFFLKKIIVKKSFQCVLFFIDDFNRKHDVVAWFSPLQGENN